MEWREAEVRESRRSLIRERTLSLHLSRSQVTRENSFTSYLIKREKDTKTKENILRVKDIFL